MGLPVLIENYMFNHQIKVLSILDESKENITIRTGDAFPLYRWFKTSHILQHQINGEWHDIKLEDEKVQERLF
ncbi:hypothetical protein [Pediococcus pentosaceus]|uniref:hypothetical protein n=1 Tax=Pediococcus pentosaceus TaxID=1255 RepID=UPI0018A15535|nr:hypothetical protein [Pediococcus pentosaceus]MBF7109909.1 hypothetical protein [Pediococcus pentosaceus]MBF7122058.1 hypothetical protein [Pediococcus pentosaceus]QQA91580.1 hypothetical protein I6H68_04545 [Pediococcus pentosaceus]